MRRGFALLALLAASSALWMNAGSTDWLKEVPVRERQRTNPYSDHKEAVQAGRLLFAEHCAQCHGDNANGKSKKPSLRTERIQSAATDGDLHWLLANGNIRRGMPSWSKLPDPQLWQLVSYVKSLKAAE